MKIQLKELRARHGWTQAELAAQLDVSRQTVVALENDRYNPSLPLAFAVAGVFDCRIEDVFYPSAEP